MPAPIVEGMEWEDWLALLEREWEPGQHMCIIAPTHQGKTTAAVGIMKRAGRKFCLAFDPKGGDSTLAHLEWPRIPDYPPRRRPRWALWQPDPFIKMAEGEPFRAIVGPIVRTKQDRERLRHIFKGALDGIFEHGGWTVLIDEFQILSDRRQMDLGAEVETLLIAARDKGVSVVTLFQAPRWVPRAAADQSEFILVGITRDLDVVDRLAEILGRPRSEIRGAIEGLHSRDYSWIVARNNPRRALVVTIPEKVA